MRDNPNQGKIDEANRKCVIKKALVITAICVFVVVVILIFIVIPQVRKRWKKKHVHDLGDKTPAPQEPAPQEDKF